MQVTYEDKLVLYQHGFFVKEFDSFSEIGEYLQKYAENGPFGRMPASEMNKLCFSIVPSKYIRFKD